VIAALELGLPFRAPELSLPVEDPRIDELLERAAALALPASRPAPLRRLGALRVVLRAEEAAAPANPAAGDEPAPSELATALLGWAPAVTDLGALREAVDDRRRRLAELRREDAPLSLATAHGTKGLEWDHVVVLADGFPGRRSISDAIEPERALEEERRLAYVAWTRARRSLTLLFDPEAPPPFLLEAFEPWELGVADPAEAA
jgi:superfamily I DNA/RNA helicase